jgi:transposase-like protein
MTSFVIPSFQRPEICRDQTLKFLERHGVANSDIYLVLRVDDPYLNDYMDRASGMNILITDIKGIGNTHNYITQFFNENQFIVEIDDDLQDLIDEKRVPITNFKEIIEEMKQKMSDEKISYGGSYQVCNPKFMSANEHYTTDLRYMLGAIRMRFIRKHIILETQFAEDFENCLQHFVADGKILKNNWIAPKTKNYSPGGCDASGRNFDTEKADKEHLAKQYPHLCRLFQRKNGRYDLRLKEYKS